MTPKQLEIIEKVLKLMELAKEENGGHEGERANAQKLAAKLMADYSLDFADLRSSKPKEGYFMQFDMVMDKDVVDWEGTLAHGISKAFDVKVIQSKWNGWKLMFCGTKTDIDISVYFFKHLRRTVSVQSSRAFHKKADIKTFAYGMVNEINRRMLELYQKRNEMFSSDSRALMVVKQDGLDKFVAEQFPNLRKGRATRLTGSHEAHRAGIEAGKKVSLNRAVSGGSAPAGRIA